MTYSLEQELNLQKQTSFKLEDLNRKVTQLESLNYRINKEALSYRQKLYKLESSQDYAGLLYQLKEMERQKKTGELQ